MNRHLALALALTACAPPSDTLADLPDPFAETSSEGMQAPPTLVLDGPAEAVPGHAIVFTITGAGDSEPIYLGLSLSTGPGPCLPSAGGLCLDLPAPAGLVTIATADSNGGATIAATIPAIAPLGASATLQAVIIRGLGGFASAKSNAITVDLVADIFGCTDPNSTNYDPAATADDGTCAVVPVPGCTDPNATNYNPNATVDDGSCSHGDVSVPGYTGLTGPDLSGQGFALCGGTDDGTVTSSQFYAQCEGYSEIIFGCSVDPGASAEFISPVFTYTGQVLSDRTCDDWNGGANTPYNNNSHILSIDSSDPSCGNYNVGYDMYMDMGNQQWGCAQTDDTHNTGGVMWAWVR